MLRIGLALLAVAAIAVVALLVTRMGDEPIGEEPALAPPSEPRLTDQMEAQKVVDAYLSALHELPPKMPDNPTPALKSDGEKQAYLRGLRAGGLNAYLDCAAAKGAAVAIDGAAGKVEQYSFLGAKKEGERVRVKVGEGEGDAHRVEFVVVREEGWRIEGTSALEAALVEGCR